MHLKIIGSRSVDVRLVRAGAGQLFAGETGLDWRERHLVLTDAAGRETARFRAGRAAVEFPNQDDASIEADWSEAWWRSTMPPGTTPQSPPGACFVTALLGAWWPWPDRRVSVRGNLGWQRPWREATLSDEPGWDRRQQRRNALIALATVAFVAAVAVVGVGVGSWTAGETVGIGLPTGLALVLLTRAAIARDAPESHPVT